MRLSNAERTLETNKIKIKFDGSNSDARRTNAAAPLRLGRTTIGGLIPQTTETVHELECDRTGLGGTISQNKYY
jgi:hypothetical protein